MRRWRRWGLLSALLVGAAALAGLAAADTVTRGQTGADTTCDTPENFAAVQTGISGGTPYTVPSGQWTITSWSAQGGPGAGREALVVFRPTGTPNQYLVVGATSPQTLADTQNTFSADIKVEGGDLIGFWAQAGTRCAHVTGSTADSVGICLPQLGPCSATSVPDRNDTLTVTPLPEGGFRLNMSVVLKSRPSSSGNNPAPSPVVEPEPARIAICTAKPIQRTDGTIGTFADVLASEYPTTDPASPYYGAAPAKYAQGIGLTCDNLPGHTDAGYRVNGDGVRAPAGLEASWPAPYEYYTKTL